MLKSVELNCWINPDFKAHGSYSATYCVVQDRTALYSVSLNQQGGFYGISEFVGDAGGPAFVLEQINNSGRARVAVFDKASGEMLGTFGDRKVFDATGDLLLTLERVKDRADFADDHFSACRPEDWLASQDGRPVALFACLNDSPGMLKRWQRWLEDRSHAPSPVMRVDIERGLPADERLIYAIAVVIHSRRGISLPQQALHAGDSQLSRRTQ